MSGYREDEEALRAKVERLEGELGGARTEIERLRGRALPPAPADVPRSRLLGTPLSHQREVELPFEIDADGYAAIARLLRQRLGVEASQVGGDLTAKHFSLTRDGHRTRIRVSTDLRGRAGGVVAASFLSVLLPGLPIVGALADIANHGGPHLLPLHALWAVPSIAIGVGAYVRSRQRKAIADEITKLDEIFVAVGDLAAQHQKPSTAAKVRVESAARDVETDAEAEADAPREAKA